MDALTPGEKLPGNMFVPIDLVKPVLDEMVRTGHQHDSDRPWLGLDSLEEDGRIKVMQVNDEGPAEKAGITAGDIILQVNGANVAKLEDFYHALWASQPGAEFRLTVLHGTTVKDILVQSMDRQKYVRHKPSV
jgi:S1-C subfamily serine protease